jgi:hypothetical protein
MTDATCTQCQDTGYITVRSHLRAVSVDQAGVVGVCLRGGG